MPTRLATGIAADALAGRLVTGTAVEDLAAKVHASDVRSAPSYPDPDRLTRFIRIVGVTEVEAALNITVDRLERHARGSASPVADAWDYLVAVVNGRPARLRYVYVLLYLWETTLRNVVDQVVGGARGPNWYQTPGAYMHAGTERRVAERHPEVFAGGGVVPQASAMAFLEQLFLWALHAIVLDSWAAFASRFRDPATGRPPPYEDVRVLLEDIEQYRRHTMHVRPMNNPAFKEATAKLRKALGFLEVNVDRALKRIAERDPGEEDWHLFLAPGVAAP